MKNFKNKKTLQIVLLVVIAVVTLGIGYAAISAVNLIINGNATARVDQNNFKVHFIQAQAISGSTGAGGTSNIDSGDDTKAMFDVTGLTKVGDYAEAVYTVRNDSNGVGAEISLSVSNSNSEYFKVTETILDNKLQAGEETTAKVKVEMIKTPITDSVSTSVTSKLNISPIEDAAAYGGSSESIEPDIPYVYTINNNPTRTNINQSIPSEIMKYEDFEAAKTAIGHPIALAHIINNGVISESYVSFEKNNKIYYFRGGIDEHLSSDKPIFEKNLEVIKKAYGDNWASFCSGDRTSLTCDDSGLRSSVCADCYVAVSVEDNSWKCIVTDGNSSYCMNK